tara:strand:+ start:1057 stop:1629 length:573 start_codon:yes stop_codon:yes gene_type:complete
MAERKFINATFTNSDRDNVEVMWKDPESEEHYIENVEVNDQDVSFKELMGYVSFDDIVDATAERNRKQRRDFELAAVAIGQAEGWIPKEQGEAISNRIREGAVEDEAGNVVGIKTESQIREEVFKDINNMLFMQEEPEDKETKELMFMLKLYVFDQDKVSKHKDKKLKAACRKAKTPFEVIKTAVQLLDE